MRRRLVCTSASGAVTVDVPEFCAFDACADTLSTRCVGDFQQLGVDRRGADAVADDGEDRIRHRRSDGGRRGSDLISAWREWRKAARTSRRVDTSWRRRTDALIGKRHRLADAAQLKRLRAVAKNCELSLECHNVLRSAGV